MSKGKTIKFYASKFAVSSGFEAGVAITAITNANPAVVTKAAHGVLTGDVVKFEGIAGMVDLNDGLYVAKTLTTDTFALIGVDSLNYDPFTLSGTPTPTPKFLKAIFSPSCEVTDYKGDTGETAVISTETNCGESSAYGSPKAGSVSISFNKASSAFQTALKDSRANVTPIALKTIMPSNAGTMIDIGTVTKFGDGGSAGGVWSGTADINRDGERVDLA